MTKNFHSSLRPVLLVAALAWSDATVPAYPPAPHHQLFGMVRDSYGTPLTGADAKVVFETTPGRTVRAPVVLSASPGMNYTVAVPMDSGATADLYRPDVHSAETPFRLRVRLGSVTYLPIEMRGDFVSLGRPGERTRLDLTLGEDSDGDGLPDAWELALIAARGGGLQLSDLRPDDDLDGDGRSNRAEYLAGTYAFDAADGLSIALVTATNGRAVLEVFALRGRSYSVQGSGDLSDWRTVPFTLVGDSSAAPLAHFTAPEARLVRFQVEVPDESESPARFFKVRVN